MALEKGCVESIYNLGCYYELIKKYESMEVYYLMAINRGNIDSLRQLINYYQKQNQIEKMTYFCILAMEKHNDQSSMDILTDHFKDNATELIKQVKQIVLSKQEKGKYQCLVIKYIPLMTTHFRFRDGSITTKILNYHFLLNKGISESTIYHQIKTQDPQILDYLNIHTEEQLKPIILQFINTWC